MNGRIFFLIRWNHFHCRSWLLTSRRDKHWRSSTMVAECGEEKNQQQASSTWNGIEKWFLNDESGGESVRVFNFTPINRRCIIWICWRKKQQHRRQKLIKLKRSHFCRVAFSSCRFKQNTNKTKKKEKVHHRIRTVFFLVSIHNKVRWVNEWMCVAPQRKYASQK